MAVKLVHPDTPHKYMRIKYGGRDAFKCQLPKCTHFLTHAELAIGRESLCWRCGNSFIIKRTDASFYAKKLKCGECKPAALETKFEESQVDDLLAKLGIDLGEKE